MSDAALLRVAAREFAAIAGTLRETSVHVTASLNDGAVALPRAPARGLRAQRALLRAVTNRRGLGYAVSGGVLGTFGAKVGGVVGAQSLAVLVMTTSLRLRIAAVSLDNPELADDPLLRRLNAAVAADRQVESARALYALVKERGAAGALTGLAPVFGEVLALRALLDGNPLNDNTAWLIATGTGTATADPVTGMSNRAIAVLDVGDGAALRTEPEPGLRTYGSLLDFLTNLAVIGPTGRALVQVVSGSDGRERYVVMAPGMKMGTPDGDSPGDLIGAFSSTVLGRAPYSRALAKAIEDFGVPSGAEIALIGHSAGGAAVLSLVQDAEFCVRYEVTHAVAVGSPVDFKVPASPRTWVASITNQHDIIPSLDGQGAGNCFDLHPDWYVVDYTDPTHLFPACHSIEHYTANIVDDLPEARAEIDRNLAPYLGPVTRSQLYRLYDQAPAAVPTHQAGAYELPGRGPATALPDRLPPADQTRGRRPGSHSLKGPKTALTAHAQTLAADAEALAGCVERLRDLTRRLRDHEAVPPWLYGLLDSHHSACAVAHADLTTAAARMQDLAAVSPSRTASRGQRTST